MPSITDSLKPLAGVAVGLLKSELDANRTELVADVTKSGGAVVAQVEDAIIAGLPKNGILANAESAVVKNAIKNVAAQLVAQIPNLANAVVDVVDNELAQLEKTLGA